jgi:Flp pilus assembly protein TadD
MTTRRPLPLLGVLRALCTPVAVVALATGCASNHYVTAQPVATPHATDARTDEHIAESALEGGDAQLAVSLFDKMLKADPHSLTAQLGLGDAMYQIGDLARAGVLYAGVLSAAPGDPRAHLGLARVALRERRLDEAVSRYRELAAANPDNPVVAEGLGAALDLLGKHAEAQEVYRTTLLRHPEIQGLKADLGLSLVLSGNARAGANVLLDIASLPDAPPQARENLALAYGLLGNSGAAKRILSAAMPSDSVEDNLRFYSELRERYRAQAGDGATLAQAVPAAGVSSLGAPK